MESKTGKHSPTRDFDWQNICCITDTLSVLIRKHQNKIGIPSTILCIYFALLPFVSPNHALAASFDCVKSKSKAEKIICDNPSISRLDEELHEIYLAAKSFDDGKAIVNDQRAWLKLRNECATIDCVRQVYTRRLKELSPKQKLSPFLRKITIPIDKNTLKRITRADEFLTNRPKVFPPYPDIWGVKLPYGVNVFGIYPSTDGDFIVGAYGKNNSDYEWLSINNSYVMTGLFSGKQWRISDRDPFLERNRNNNGTLSLIKKVPCPIPIPANDPDMRDTCYAEIDHRFPNGNRLLYVSTDHEVRYCHRERYFRYFALVAPDGRVMKQVTPIMLSKTKKFTEDFGGDPPCEDLPGGKKYKVIANSTMAPEIDFFTPLADGTFLLGINRHLVRFDQNFTSRNPIFGKELFIVDTKALEKMGNIYTDSRKSIFENSLQTDRKIYKYLIDKNKERR